MNQNLQCFTRYYCYLERLLSVDISIYVYLLLLDLLFIYFARDNMYQTKAKLMWNDCIYAY